MNQRSITRTWSSLGALFALVAVGACAAKPEPAGRLTVSPDELELGYPTHAGVEFAWQMDKALEPLSGAPLVFVHLVDQEGKVVRTFDHPLPKPWQPGTEQRYSLTLSQSLLAPPLTEGTYRLTAGLYDSAGERFALATEGPEVAGGEYQVAEVRAIENVRGVPRISFSSSWLAVEGGTDLQVLARRWMSGDATLRVGRLRRRGTLRIVVAIVEGGGRLQNPIVEEGATQQSVTVATTCGGAEAVVTGSGRHTVLLPLEPVTVGEPCEISFDSNYTLPSLDSDEHRTALLEELSWSPARPVVR